MNEKRLYLRERTKAVLIAIKNKGVFEQFSFFGCENRAELKVELDRVERLLSLDKASWKMWDIIDIETTKVLGTCDFHNWFPEHERAELGYFLFDRFQGNGYMTEALMLLFNYGFNEMNLNRIEAFVGPENQKSLNVVQKLGFTKEGLLRQHYKFNDKIHDSLVFSLLKSEYKA